MLQFKKSRVLASAALGFGFAIGMGAALPAYASLAFNFTYGAGISAFPTAEQTSVKDSMNYIASEFSSDFSNNATLNITVDFNASVGLAQSVSNYEDNAYSYAQLRTALLANTPGDGANVPASNPTTYTTFTTTSANAKALGLALQGNATDSDGTATFGSGPWTFFPDQSRMAVGAYDFTGSMEHEVSEIMGRQSLLPPLSNNQIGPFDLFRYSAPGVRSLDPATNADGTAVSAYFSTDNGSTNLIAFNDVTGGDIHDWAGLNHDSFDAFGPTDDAEPVTAVDLQAMNAIGWTTVPEPASMSLIAFGSIGLLARRRRAAN